MRLNFQASEERLARLEDESGFKRLSQSKSKSRQIEGQKEQAAIRAMLQTLDAERLYMNRANFVTDVKAAAETADIKLKKSLLTAILNALSERDPNAEIYVDKDGQPEADSKLRDYENIPLDDEIEAYFKREVLPHVPDAWIDYSRTVKGYEINFTRYFYEYKPLRSLADIRADILALEAETDGLLQAAMG